MKTKDNPGARARWVPRFAAAYAYASTVVLALMGFMLVYTSLDGHRRLFQLLASPDALFGVSTRTALLVAGLLHLVLCGAFLLVRDPMGRGMLGTWAAWNYLIYRGGMTWLRAATPFPSVQAVARKIGAQPNTVDWWWKLLIGYLLLGGTALLVAERHRLKHLKADAFLKHWREMREAPLTASRAPGPASPPIDPGATKPRTPAPTSSKPEPHGSPLPSDLKFSCPRCGQHIRCDVAYSGSPISCPGCHENIQVPPTDAQIANRV